MTATFYPYSRYLEKTFGAKTYKVVVSSGLGCPVRCDFCDIRGSSSFFGKQGRANEITEQLTSRIPQIKERFHAQKFLAHFQSYTNTNAPLDLLREIYSQALSHPEVEGLIISTRPDCLPDPVLQLLEEIASQHYVSLELGVQSFEDSTLEFIGRGHSREASLDALDRLRRLAPHVQVCVHLILGAPTDTANSPEQTAQLLNSTPTSGVKLHQLMILQNSKLGQRWLKEPFPTLTLPQYTQKIATFLEHLSPQIYIERLCATASHSEECLAPDWSKGRWGPHNQIRKLLDEMGCQQGRALQ